MWYTTFVVRSRVPFTALPATSHSRAFAKKSRKSNRRHTSGISRRNSFACHTCKNKRLKVRFAEPIEAPNKNKKDRHAFVLFSLYFRRFLSKSLACHTSKIRASKSSYCHTYKNKGFKLKVHCLPHIFQIYFQPPVTVGEVAA